MFEVLEHVDQPMAMIKRATDLLEPGGILYLTTPNYNSFDRFLLGAQWDIFHPEHITYFSTRGLARLIRLLEPRLRLVSVKSNNISPQLVCGVIDFLKNLHLGHKKEILELSIAESGLPIDLRKLSESSRYSRMLKKTINQALSALGMGATTIITAKKA